MSRLNFLASPIFTLIWLVIFLVLIFLVALFDIAIDNLLGYLGVFALIVFTFLLTLITYINSALKQTPIVFFLLLISVTSSFLLAITAWFIAPEISRLEPLATMLGILLALVGFLSSSSELGIARLEFKSGENGLQVHVHLRLSQEKDDNTPDNPDENAISE